MVPLLCNSVEVSMVTNISVSRNTVTNSNVSYTQLLAKDRYALWMDNRCFPSNQTARGTFLKGLGRWLLLGPAKGYLRLDPDTNGWVVRATEWAREERQRVNKWAASLRKRKRSTRQYGNQRYKRIDKEAQLLTQLVWALFVTSDCNTDGCSRGIKEVRKIK
jgi:hypothetical protein